MEESISKLQSGGNGEKEIIYSRAIKAGKRIYYLDVKKNLKNDLFLAITESKKIQAKENAPSSFEKHKIFLYKEDFDKFLNGLNDVIGFIKKHNNDPAVQQDTTNQGKSVDEDKIEDIKLNIDFSD
ncbi:MAG: PUR family DNA/RNA-binding protein [Tannerellaceae bacterium]|jgi:hypothetical protein|nr:PUR family DNA/RNA-binding protein [Tannerellaceae bacterium]